MEYIAAAIAFVALLAWDGWRRFIDTRDQRIADEVAEGLREQVESLWESSERAHAKLLEQGAAISGFSDQQKRLKALEDESERMKSVVSRTASGIDHITGARRRKAV